MTTLTQQTAFQRRIGISPAALVVALLRRAARALYDAMILARERQTQRDIDRLVSARDGGFTDSLEREIAEHSYSGGWSTFGRK